MDGRMSDPLQVFLLLRLTSDKLKTQSELLVRLLRLTDILSGSFHGANQIQPRENTFTHPNPRSSKKKVLFGANETQSRFHQKLSSGFRTFHRRTMSDKLDRKLLMFTSSQRSFFGKWLEALFQGGCDFFFFFLFFFHRRLQLM